MRRWSRYLVGVVAVTGLFVLVTHTGAETCTLELKRVDLSARTVSPGQLGSFLARYSTPQSFFQQLGGPQGMIVRPSTGSKPKLEFSNVIKKEPGKYVTDTPFRGVAALGSGHYGFVLDVAPSEKDEKQDEEKAAEQKEENGASLISKLSAALASPAPPRPTNKPVSYTRLYFDLNHNGDLTDDEVIEATASRTYSIFPTVELTINVDGKKLDYAFTFKVYSRVSSGYAYATASLNSAAYREGEITLDGKKRRIVLIDFNSNGRFDDAVSFHTSGGAVSSVVGDTLHIDPNSPRISRSLSSMVGGGSQHPVSKLISIDGRFFDLAVDPSGETLSLGPTSVPLGFVTNPNKGFRAVVYGDQGILNISPDDSGKVSIPEGEWRLMSYTIARTEAPKPAVEKADEEKSVLDVLSSAGTIPAPPTKPPGLTRVSARIVGDVAPVKVVKGKTAGMRFGLRFTRSLACKVVKSFSVPERVAVVK